MYNFITGTVIIRLEISDEDFDVTPVDLYITSGDNLCQFNIKSTGEVFVTKPLDREAISKYKLDIIATDGKHSTFTVLVINVLDINGKYYVK